MTPFSLLPSCMLLPPPPQIAAATPPPCSPPPTALGSTPMPTSLPSRLPLPTSDRQCHRSHTTPCCPPTSTPLLAFVSRPLSSMLAGALTRVTVIPGTWRVGGCRVDPCLLWWTRCDGPAPCSGMGGGPHRRTLGSAGHVACADAESCGQGARCRQRPHGEGPGRCCAREHEDRDGIVS